MAKDTPNFIANRVGVHAMMATVQVMNEMGLTIEEVDALTGPAIGRPKTATFKLADLVGLDTFVHVADNIYPLIPDDEAREAFKVPDYLHKMVEKGLLGRKSGGGFYKMEKKPEKKFFTLDLETLEYRDKQKAKFPEIAAAKAHRRPGRAPASTLAFGKGKAGQAIWKMLAASFSYSAMRLGEICDQAAEIDQAVRWGFNWELGPFEVWDALGFRKVTERMREDGLPLPAWVDALYDSGAETLYRDEDGVASKPHRRARRLRPGARPTRASSTSTSCAAAGKRSQAQPRRQPAGPGRRRAGPGVPLQDERHRPGHPEHGHDRLHRGREELAGPGRDQPGGQLLRRAPT